MTADGFNLLDALPHRPPFRFLSCITHLQRGAEGRAEWQVQGDEPFFQGHFPGQPIVPGVLIVEAMAQLSGLVGFYRGSTDDDTPASGAVPSSGKLAHVEVRFHEPVFPPATILLHSRGIRTLGTLHQFEVEASVGDRTVSQGRITLARADDPNETSASDLRRRR